MRTLIDGYNLMHAVVLLPGRLTAQQLERKRRQFLNELAARLGPIEAAQTTIVFDSSRPAGQGPDRGRHKSMEILFGTADDTADDRIESLIAQHSAPKTLRVVSSDRRIRQAAGRRKAKSIDSDTFWQSVGRPTTRAPQLSIEAGEAGADPGCREAPLDPAEAAYWAREFGAVMDLPELDEMKKKNDFIPSAADLARIAREVEREFE